MATDHPVTFAEPQTESAACFYLLPWCADQGGVFEKDGEISN